MTEFSNSDTTFYIISLLVFLPIVILFVVYLYFFRKKSALLFERREKESQYQQELTHAIIEMKETTLSYIGQELHDDLGQKMSVAKLMVNHGLENATGEQREILLEINEIIGESIRDIRSLSKSFITEQIENLGLVESIQKEVARIDRLNLMKIQFTHNTNRIKIEPKDGLILFRIIQECINNVLKHSRAKNMNIDLVDGDKTINITLKDDGIGFENDGNKKGSGLLSMRKRANLIHTDFQLTSEKGKGTSISINYNKI